MSIAQEPGRAQKSCTPNPFRNRFAVVPAESACERHWMYSRFPCQRRGLHARADFFEQALSYVREPDRSVSSATKARVGAEGGDPRPGGG